MHNDLFREFGTPFTDLSESAMDKIIPVYVFEPDRGEDPLKDIAINWQLHAAPYLASLTWFINLMEAVPAAKASEKVKALSLTRKTMIKRGYQIRYKNQYPPLMNGDQYYLNLDFKDRLKSSTDFPVGRILKNRAGELYVR
jgi:hypothetical protein